MTIPEKLSDMFRDRLKIVGEEAVRFNPRCGCPRCRPKGVMSAVEKFFKGLEPHVLCLYLDDLKDLINSGPLEAYAIPHPDNSAITIVVKRDFAMRALALGELP